jgi:hypothetical protein
MKKRVLLTLALTFGLAAASVAQNTFGFVEKYGFSSISDGYQRSDITCLESFKGKLYVGTGNDSGNVYRSASGDPGTFSRVLTQSNRATRMAVTNDGAMGGYLYVAFEAGAGYNARVKRTADGVTWQDYYVCADGNDNINALNMFRGSGAVDSVYIMIGNGFNSTGYVMRGSVDANDPNNSSSSFTMAGDLYAQFGTTYVEGSYSRNDSLFYTFGKHLVKTGGMGVFEENLSLNLLISPTNNDYIRSMCQYNGDLYLASNNFSDGCQLLKTSDGINYTLAKQFTTDSAVIILKMYAAGSKLWMIAANYSDELRVYSMDNTGTFYNDNMNEFGFSENYPYNGTGIVAFQNHLYIGTASDGGGGGKRLAAPADNHIQTVTIPYPASQIWRTCLLDTMPMVSILGDGDTSVCAGTSVTLTAAPGMVSYLWENMNTSQFLSTTLEGYHTVTGTDGNGCKNSADYWVNNPATIPAYFTDSSTSMNLSNIIVCRGDTSATMMAHAESDIASLHITGLSQGMITPGSSAFSARQITVELWVKPNVNAPNSEIMTEYDLNGTWTDDNHDMIEYFGNSIYIELAGVPEFSMPVNAGQWNHVVLRFDGSTLTGLMNGVPSGGYSLGSWFTPDSNQDAFKFGYDFQNGAGSHGAFDGYIRDVRIWNSVRSDIDIANNMFSLTPGSYPDLIYHYLLNEGSGNVANDISGNNNNSVSVTGLFVTPQMVTVTPSTGLIDHGNNYFSFHPMQTTTYAATYINSMGCQADTAFFTVTVPKMSFAGSVPAVCGGLDASIHYDPDGAYSWSPSVVPTGSFVVTPSPQPTGATWYVMTGNTFAGNCPMNDSILINVGPTFTAAPSNIPPLSACEGNDVVLHANASGGTAPYTIFWYDNANGNVIDSTMADSLVYNVGFGMPPIINVAGHDAIGCPMDNGGFNGFFINTTPSTDLHGHVSTPPPASLNVDNGEVYVFIHQPGSAAFDTLGHVPLDANGNYVFSPLTAGDYLIKVMADETDFPTGVPTYYGNAFQWDSSIVYTHGCAQTDTADVELVMLLGGSGTASISGYIREGYGFGSRYGIIGHQPNLPFAPGGPLKGIDVKLGKNPGGGIQARTMTDTSANSEGFYEFQNVPPGDYKIYVDIPNLPMDSTRELSIVLGDSSVQNNYYADSVMIYVLDTTISPVGIYSSAKQYENQFSIYPNPAKGDLYVNYTLKESGLVSFEITNAMGQVIRREPARKHPEGKNIFIFNTYQLNLQSGVYFISILSDNKKYTQRLVVIE